MKFVWEESFVAASNQSVYLVSPEYLLSRFESVSDVDSKLVNMLLCSECANVLVYMFCAYLTEEWA